MNEHHHTIDRDTPYQFGAFLLFIGALMFTLLVNPQGLATVELVIWHLTQGILALLSGRMGWELIHDLADPAEHSVRKTLVGGLLLVENPDGTWKVISTKAREEMVTDDLDQQVADHSQHHQQRSAKPGKNGQWRQTPEVVATFDNDFHAGKRG